MADVFRLCQNGKTFPACEVPVFAKVYILYALRLSQIMHYSMYASCVTVSLQKGETKFIWMSTYRLFSRRNAIVEFLTGIKGVRRNTRCVGRIANRLLTLLTCLKVSCVFITHYKISPLSFLLSPGTERAFTIPPKKNH